VNVLTELRSRVFGASSRRCPLCDERAVRTTGDEALVRLGIATRTCANQHDWITKYHWSTSA
jgi:hypothetical protein